jgi:hypothetical protein
VISSIPTKRFLSVIILLFVFLTTWQDFYLVNTFGEIFRSPIILLSPLFLFNEFFYLPQNRFYRKKRHHSFNQINIFFIILHALFIFVTFFTFLLWIFKGKELIFLNENVIIKAIKVLFYYTLFWLIFRSSYLYLYMAEQKGITISRIFLLLTVIYFFEIIFEFFKIPRAFLFMHSSDMDYWRVRMFTSEASWTGGIFLLLMSGIWSDNLKSNLKIFISIIFLILFLITSGSKQFLVGIIIAFHIFLIKKIGWKYFTLSTLLFFLSIVFLSKYFNSFFLISYFSNDIENYTSTATRIVTFIVSIISLFHFPFGTGGLYVPFFLAKIPEGIHFINLIYPYFNFDEILNLGINDTYQGISPKNSFGMMIVLIGFPGLLLLIWLYKILLQSVRSNSILYILVIYFIITSFFSENFDTKPNIAVFFSLICFYNQRSIN